MVTASALYTEYKICMSFSRAQDESWFTTVTVHIALAYEQYSVVAHQQYTHSATILARPLSLMWTSWKPLRLREKHNGHKMCSIYFYSSYYKNSGIILTDKLMHLENELPNWHSVHQKSHMDWPGTEPRTMQWEARVMFEMRAAMQAGLCAKCLLQQSGFNWKWNALLTEVRLLLITFCQNLFQRFTS
jgi:hypothetical protein